MEFKEILSMLGLGTWDTLYMVLVSTLLGYVIGLPLGILLTITDVDGINPNKVIYNQCYPKYSVFDFINSDYAFYETCGR